MIKHFTFGIYWDSNVKGNREKNGFHKRTEEEAPGLVLGKLGVCEFSCVQVILAPGFFVILEPKQLSVPTDGDVISKHIVRH